MIILALILDHEFHLIVSIFSQDFTGVPAVVDLACMRDAMKNLGSDPQKINPLVCDSD